MHTEGRESELLIALAQTRNELARAKEAAHQTERRLIRECDEAVAYAYSKAEEDARAVRLERDLLRRALLTIVSMVRGHPEYFAGEVFSCASTALATPAAAAGEDSK